MPHHQDRLLSAAQQVRPVESERERGDRVRVPVKRRRRRALLHLRFRCRCYCCCCGSGGGGGDRLVQTIPQPDVALVVSGRKVFLRRVEGEARESLRRDKLDESRFEVGRRGHVGFVAADGDEPRSARGNGQAARGAGLAYQRTLGRRLDGLLLESGRRRFQRYPQNDAIVVVPCVK